MRQEMVAAVRYAQILYGSHYAAVNMATYWILIKRLANLVIIHSIVFVPQIVHVSCQGAIKDLCSQ